MIPNKTIDLNGFRIKFEVKDVTPQFVNAIRRILLNEMPVVEVDNVNILSNTTLMPHEMVKLRTELLPVNVRPTEEDLIRSVKLTLKVDQPKKVYTSDFEVTSGRSDILLNDRDLSTPLYFLKMKEGESIHLTAGLRVNPNSSHVCVATYSIHVDEERAETDKEEFLKQNPDGEVVFDNYYRQKSVALKDGRPYWFDFTVESIGLIPARELVKDAVQYLKKIVLEWTKNEIIREKEMNVYQVVTNTGGHTVGALVQSLLYTSGLCEFVSYDVPHPLRTIMRVRFLTTKTPEEIMVYVANTILSLCDTAVSQV